MPRPPSAEGSKSRKGEAAQVAPRRRAIESGRTAFVAIFVLAAALRLAYGLASRKSPFFGHLDLDSRFYDLWAKRIAAGDWVGDEVFFMGPLYPYFLAVVYKLVGVNLLAVKSIQSVIGGLTAGLTYLLGRHVFGPPVGIIAGLMAALYVPFIFHDNAILLPVLATLLNALMLYLLSRGLAARRPRVLLAAGLVGGLSAAGNASILAFVPVAAAFILFWGRWNRGAVARAALFVAGVLLIILPITVRNYVVGHDLVLVTSNAGLNLYIGNNPKSSGAYVKPEGLDVYADPEGKTIAAAATGRRLKPSEVSRYWTGRAVEFARTDPGRFASNLARKAFFFWSVYEIPQIEHLPFEKRYSWILRIPSPSFGMVCPLGLLGMALALRKTRVAWLHLLFIATYSASIVAFFVVARYRLPMVPALIVFAAYSVCWLAERGAEKAWRSMAYSLAALVALFAFLHTNFYKIHPLSGFAQSYYRLGVIYDSKGDQAAALENYRKAVDLDPTLAPARLNLGIELSRQGRFAEAEAEIARAVDLDPEYARAQYNLGFVYAQQGKADSAVSALERALSLDPAYGLAKLTLAGVYYEIADFARAESLLAALRTDGSLGEASRKQAETLASLIPQRREWIRGRRREAELRSDRELLKGDNLYSVGLVGRAFESYALAVEIDPASATALYQVGTIHFGRGELDKARGYFVRVLESAPRYPGAHFALGVIAFRGGRVEDACREFQREVEVDPGSGASHLNLAVCYEEHLGDLDRAAYHLRRYIELTGGTNEARAHLRELEARIGRGDR